MHARRLMLRVPVSPLRLPNVVYGVAFNRSLCQWYKTRKRHLSVPRLVAIWMVMAPCTSRAKFKVSRLVFLAWPRAANFSKRECRRHSMHGCEQASTN